MFLSREDVEGLLTGREVVDEIEGVFKAKGIGEDFQEFKVRIHKNDRDYFYGIGCYVKSKAAPGIKWTGIYKDNVDKGLPLITGIVVLNDPNTGIPLGIVEGGVITGIRTPAFSGLAAKYLANTDSNVIAIIGCGYQGRTHLQIFDEIFEIRKVKAFDIRQNVLGDYVKDMKKKFGFEVEAANSVKDAVRGSDIVCLLTTARETVVYEEWIEPGCFVTGTNSFYDLDPKLSNRADKWVVGDMELDIRTIIEYEKQDVLRSNVYADLGQIVTGKKPGRERDEERILFTHRGMPSLDIVTAKMVYEKAKKTNVGTKVKLF